MCVSFGVLIIRKSSDKDIYKLTSESFQIREIAEESSNSIASMSDEEIKAENQLILKEHCARYAEPPVSLTRVSSRLYCL